eukprot:gene12753-14060_t
MGLNDAEVKKQIQHMMDFIHQEAKEKAEEIDAKAEEEFNIEKGRLVQQERLKIMSFYEKKEKQIELQLKIQRSNFLNQSRLKILKAQDDHIAGLLEETQNRLGHVTDDKEKYKNVLEGLITQGLFQILEPQVILKCRKVDVHLVKDVIGRANKIYKSSTEKDCKLIVDENDFLPSDCSGGIELVAKEGKIRVVNTLESRLELLSRQEMRRNIFELFFAMVACCCLKVSATDWPSGTYALPRPVDGCPVDWKEGMRYQDSENMLNTNNKSASYHLSGSVNKHGVRQEFCTKTDDAKNGITWPTGQYCIYKYGYACPEGLVEGWVFWDDENDEMIDASNLYGGYVPSGIYEADTLIYTCCRIDGDKNIPISLPTAIPFYLLAYGSADCQKVIGATSTQEFVKWDDEDKGNRNDNSRVVPFDVKKNRWNTKIYYCYYQFKATSICEGKGATCQNTTQFDNSQAAKSAIEETEKQKKSEVPGSGTASERTSGLAVAIGSSIAAAIVGSAALAFVARHFLTKKAEVMNGNNEHEDSEEEVFPMPDEMCFTSKLLNGAIAGSVGTACIFPLDLAKTRLQDQRTVSKVGSQQVNKLYKNVFHCMYKVARVEGIRGLYKGLGVNILLVNPEKAIKLAVNDQARVMLGGGRKFMPLHKEMLAGALAGLCQVSVTTPMEFLKIQMQVAGRNTTSSTGGTKQLTASEVASQLLKQKGISGVYRGLGATLARDVPFSFIYFPMFAFLNIKGFKPDGSRPHPFHSLASGLFSGMTASLAVNPLDVIKTRLQVLKRVEGEPTYNGIIDCAAKIYKQEGIAAFYKGAVPRMIVIAPLFGIAQMVYFFGVAEKLLAYGKPQTAINKRSY